MSALTVPQRRMLEFLRDGGKSAPRALAKKMWPDSVGWSKRTRKFGTNDPGAIGGTMPMKAATLLWRLHSKNLAALDEYDRWTITPDGLRALKE